MTGVTTGQTSLATATDSDDTETFLTGPLTTDLQAVANLFESATGHDHTGAGKGKPIGSAGIATGVALTNPVVSGAGGTPAGTLGFSGTSLLVGDGTVNRAVNVGPWVTFAPTLNQGGAVATTITWARYAIIGKLAVVQMILTAAAAGGAGNITITGLPAAITAAIASNALPVGTFYYSGAANRSGVVIQTTTTSLAFFVDNSAGYLGGAPAATLAIGHVVSVNAAWEIA
jgi:hypothetical protein